MVGMAAVFVVAAIVVVGAVVARVTWRRPADERHSIQSHQQTLATLRSMADRRADGPRDRADGPGPDARSGAAVRPTRPRSGPVHAASTRPGSVRAPVSRPSAGNGHHELVFTDEAPAAPSPGSNDRGPAQVLGLGRALPRSGLIRGGGSRGRRSRQGGVRVVAAGVVLVAVVVGVAVALAPSHHDGAAPPTTHQPKTTTRVTRPPTTVPPPPELRATTASSTTADYAVPSADYTVSLQATGLCWVEATEVATGNVVWTGTLASGQSRSVPATGNLFLRLGAADDVTVAVNGEPVVLPAGFHSPFNMSFAST
jgi:hypothetical protein